MSPDASAAPDDLEVRLGERAYHILIGDGLIANAAEHVGPLLSESRVVVVSDRNVEEHHLAPFLDSLGAAGIAAVTLVLPPGEGTKDFLYLQELVDKVLAAGIERRTMLVAFGGGVIGDLAGFVAAIALRGIDFIQIPTTLLAQVDSSVGGKTGINTSHGKNLIGAFHQPRLVLADTGALDTLPRRQLLAGYAEVLKYGLIGDADFFAWCEGNAKAVLGGDAEARRHAVRTSCEAKAAIVAEDEREQGRRALLNLGHTFGHALEAETGYGDALLHGEAVAVGCVLAFELSARMGLCEAADGARLRTHLESVGLPASLKGIASDQWSAEKLIRHMHKDKKVAGGAITFILARGIGQAFISHDVGVDDVTAVLNDALAAAV